MSHDQTINKMVAVIAILVTSIVVLFTILLIKLEKKRRKYDQFGGPKSLPIVGNVHQMKRSPREFTKQLYEWFDKYGPSGRFRIMLSYHPITVICNPEDAEPLLNSNKHIDKSVDYEFLLPWLNTGLLLSTGEKWKTRRKLLTPTFHFKILNDFVQVFNKQTKVLLGKLKDHSDGRPYNITTDLTLCALDIICETAMGKSVDAQGNTDSEYVQAVYKISDILFKRVRSPWYWPRFLFNLIGPGKQHDHCLKLMHDFAEKVIHERSEDFNKLHGTKMTMEKLLDEQDEIVGKKRRLAFLDMLLCASTDGQKLSFLDIREEVDTFMFEGHDTTAMASNWATYLIGADPAVQKKLHEELDSIFGGSDREATMEDLQSMTYMECCIKESLRIFPSVPVFGRRLTEDTTIGNIPHEKGATVIIAPTAMYRNEQIFSDPNTFDPERFFPERSLDRHPYAYIPFSAGARNCIGNIPLEKGATILLAPIAMHRNEQIFPNPHKFDPERFCLERSLDRHPYAYIPFSAGARNCIGQKFAMLEEKVILSTIFRNFTVQSLQSRDELNPTLELILRPGNGIIVKLTPR